MKRTLANRPVAAIVVVFSVIDALILRSNPFGDGTIPWIGAIAVALAGNAVLAYVVAGWAAPYIASSGGSAGAAAADPHSVRFAEIWMSFALMIVGVIAMLAVDFASRDLIISPTQRSERNAELVRETGVSELHVRGTMPWREVMNFHDHPVPFRSNLSADETMRFVTDPVRIGAIRAAAEIGTK